MHPRYIQTCRVCSSTKLVDVVDLGEQYLQGAFVKDGITPPPPRRRLPTRLVRCDVTQNEDGCGLVQLANTYPATVLYSNYWYRSGTNATMTNHLQKLVKNIIDLINDRKSDEDLKVLDIGCNDGTLLFSYPDQVKKYGVDPSDIANELKERINLLNTTYPSKLSKIKFNGAKFDVITSIAMFYDLENPVNFAKNIASDLKESGVWVLEVSYLPLMLIQNSFDTICHEHIEYYSLAVLERIASDASLRVFNVEVNDINGGSIRCYLCHESYSEYDSNDTQSNLQKIRLLEFDMALDTDTPYNEFKKRINILRDDTRALLKSYKMQGKKVHIYGASTKGNVLLQWYGIDSDIIDYAAERNEHKVGGQTLGTEIPIISESESRSMVPDVYLVLPWHFKKEFLEREAEQIKKGTSMLFPLPNVLIVNKNNLDSVLTELDQDYTPSEKMMKLLSSS